MCASVVSCIFSNDKKKVLLIKRRDVPVWVLPGGGAEKKETLEKAIIREVKEETGFDVKIIRKIGEYTPINRLTKFTHLFECKIILGEKKIGDETREIKFFEVTDLPKKIPPPYPIWIKDGLKNKFIQRKINITYFTFLKHLILHPILVFRFLLSRLGFHLNSKH